MAKMRMKPADLGELHALLKMYVATYGRLPSDLGEIEVKFLQNGGSDIGNPRGAGRKKRISDDEVQKVLDLRAEGKSIREIELLTGISKSSVQLLIKGQ